VAFTQTFRAARTHFSIVKKPSSRRRVYQRQASQPPKPSNGAPTTHATIVAITPPVRAGGGVGFGVGVEGGGGSAAGAEGVERGRRRRASEDD